MQNQNKITYRDVPVETVAEDGTVLKGMIHYWAKDFTVCLKEPFEAQGCGSHLMYGIPVRFVTDEAHREKVIDVPLIPRAKKILASLYTAEEK